jgi:hypothetical protein
VGLRSSSNAPPGGRAGTSRRSSRWPSTGAGAAAVACREASNDGHPPLLHAAPRIRRGRAADVMRRHGSTGRWTRRCHRAGVTSAAAHRGRDPRLTNWRRLLFTATREAGRGGAWLRTARSAGCCHRKGVTAWSSPRGRDDRRRSVRRGLGAIARSRVRWARLPIYPAGLLGDGGGGVPTGHRA